MHAGMVLNVVRLFVRYRVRGSYLRFCEHVDGRRLEHHGPLPYLVALSRHDVRQKVMDVLLDESQLKDLLRKSLHPSRDICMCARRKINQLLLLGARSASGKVTITKWGGASCC